MDDKYSHWTLGGKSPLLLAFVGLAVGLYLIATTFLIAPDGIQYIRRAHQFATDTDGVIRISGIGYPFLISVVHFLFFPDSTTAIGWAYAAQGTALACRIGACLLLYGIARQWIGASRSFMAVLALLLLPYPARFGADAMRDWPYLLFLIAGMGALLAGCRNKQLGWFAVAGCLSGMAYLVRVEGTQVVLLGLIAFGVEWFVRSTQQPRKRIVIAGALLLGGFFVGGGWHMALQGRVLPEKLRFGQPKAEVKVDSPRIVTWPEPTSLLAKISPPPQWDFTAFVRTPWIVLKQTAECMSPHMMVVGLIGLAAAWRRMRDRLSVRFWIGLWGGFQVLMLIYLYSTYGYMSRRHVLPIVVALCLFVPEGLEILARRIGGRPGVESNPAGVIRMAWILLGVGMAINLPKLATPLREDKRAYRQASQWLAAHTLPDTNVLVDDPRIGFYSDRPYGLYTEKMKIPIRSGFWATIRPDRAFEVSAKKGVFLQKLFSCGSENAESVAVFAIHRSDMKARWPMDDAVNSTRVSDTGTSRWHGKALRNTAELTTGGKFHTGLLFDGTTDSVTVRTRPLKGYNAWTIAAWVKCGDTPNPTLVSFGGLFPSIQFQNNGNSRPILHMGKENFRYFSPSAWRTLRDGQWHHVAFTMPGAEPNSIQSSAMYLDGKAVDPVITEDKGPQASKSGLIFGGTGMMDNRRFSGTLDEVWLYNRALTAAEIERWYRVGQ